MTKSAIPFFLLSILGCEPNVVDAVNEPLPVKEPEPVSPLASSLIHRYSFDGEGTTVLDAKGAAHGQAVGTTLPGTGSLPLSGMRSGEYVNLPNGIVHGLEAATFEAWLTWDGGKPWQRIFDFGSNSAGEDLQGTGVSYIFLTTLSSTDARPTPSTLRLAYSHSSVGDEDLCEGSAAFPIGVETHIAAVVAPAQKSFAIYQDGMLVSECRLSRKLAAINDENNWLGHSNYSADPDLAGTYDEFRIYGAALTASQIADSFAAGPDAKP